MPALPQTKRFAALAAALWCALPLVACERGGPERAPIVRWYVFNEPSGAFRALAGACTTAANGRYVIDFALLPADADQQREQLARRLAAEDADIDVIGMDVIWTAEFARAGWILPWPEAIAERVRAERLEAATESARYGGRLWALPFTTNVQLLWYRSDRVAHPPQTWDELIDMAEALGPRGRIEAQGERYEGLTVFFTSLIASAGGDVVDPTGKAVSLAPGPTGRALAVMRRLARSPASTPALATSREDQARLGFEAGDAAFMINYPYVWPSAQRNVPELARTMRWARWPGVEPGRPSRVTIGGLNLGIGAYTRHREAALEAALCLALPEHQRIAAMRGGLLPTTRVLYDDPAMREAFPFLDTFRATLEHAVQRAQTPAYADVSIAIGRALHPMRDIEPARDAARLRALLERALRSEGLL